MWFTMIVLFAIAAAYSIKHLSSNKIEDDIYAVGFTNT
ncbi:MAG: ABC transporter permease, partial [Crocinitomicaceae bacterium]|nr:ABC transporter permease [Crocinitomicaceae bacterium]